MKTGKFPFSSFSFVHSLSRSSVFLCIPNFYLNQAMSISTLLIPASAHFWTDVVDQLLASELLSSKQGSNTQDFSALRVIVPTFAHVKLFQQALAARLERDFIPPRVSTLFALLEMQKPQENMPSISADSERLMGLFDELRKHAWISKLFGAHDETDLLPLAQALLNLSDELTQAFLPMSSNQELMREKWVSALAQLPVPVKKMISDEAQLVWSIWQSQLDQRDPGIRRFEKMMQIAGQASLPLIWISPSRPDQVESAFLQAYQQKNEVLAVHLDWRVGSLPPIYAKAWPDLLDGTEESGVVDTQCEQSPMPLLVEAVSIEDEAQKVAQSIVQHLQSGKNALAVVAQDRVVARRIRALLERANIFVSDETGWKLSTARAASLLMSWYDVISTRADTFVLLDLLKSPFVTGLNTDVPELAVAKEELILRAEVALRKANVLGSWEAVLGALADDAASYGWVKRFSTHARRFSGRKTLAEWSELHRRAMQELGWQNTLEQDEAGRQVIQMLQSIERDCQMVTGTFSFADWRGLVSLQFEQTPFIAPSIDQRVMMLPLNGAHLRSFDVVYVVGADAAHLPSRPKETLFFTNAVRRECGLVSDQERRQQQLRDWVELLLSNEMVVMSWRTEQDGEHNPVSPWIAQLALTLEQTGMTAMALHQVSLPMQTTDIQLTRQPRPQAAMLAPSSLSASAYASLRACPYQYFASRMLGLLPLDELSDLPEKRDYGDWLHSILKAFHDELKQTPTLSDDLRLQLLTQISEQKFEQVLKRSPAALGYQIRWNKVIPAYLVWLRERENQGWQFEIGEVWQERVIQWNGGEIKLHGRLDRIDRQHLGNEDRLQILDYKAKSVSSLKTRLKNGEDHQLPFYGLLTRTAATENAQIEGASYVALELEKNAIANIEADDFAAWMAALEQAITQDMRALKEGASLPAHGAESSCQFCDMRGLCRKGSWQ